MPGMRRKPTALSPSSGSPAPTEPRERARRLSGPSGSDLFCVRDHRPWTLCATTQVGRLVGLGASGRDDSLTAHPIVHLSGTTLRPVVMDESSTLIQNRLSSWGGVSGLFIFRR